MSQYPDAGFLTSANAERQFVADDGREVAFAGRSNAGKSSAINVLVNRKQFARTSKTPGRTQLVNFFRLWDDARLVDLPGYGFAKVSASKRRHWGALMDSYFLNRGSLQGLFVIVDCRRSLGEADFQLIGLAVSLGVEAHVLLSKADKLKRGQASTTLQAARKQLQGSASVQLFSSTKRQGVDEARQRLEQMLGKDS